MGIFIKSGILHTLKFHLHTLSCHFWLKLWPPHSYLVPWFPPTHHLQYYILLRCGCFAQIMFVSVRDVWLFLPDHIRLNIRRLLGFKNQGSPPHPPCFISLQSIYVDLFQFWCIYFAKQSKCFFFINSLGNSRNFLYYQWPEEFIKQKKPASKWHQIALYDRWVCFFLFVFLGFFLFKLPYYFEIHRAIIETL